MKRLSLILSLLLFVALCATASFWVLQFIKPDARKISAPPVMKPVADVETVAGLFGGAMAMNTNYQLKGIVLANPASQSGAIIAVDGKATQAYRIESEISPGVKLSEVHAAYILILDNGVSKRVDLPQDFKPQIGGGDNNSLRSPVTVPNTSGMNARGLANMQRIPGVPGAAPARSGDVLDNSMTTRNTRLRGLQPTPAPGVPKPTDDPNSSDPSAAPNQ